MISVEREQPDEHFAPRHDSWKRRGHHVRSVRSNNQVDFVYIHQLRVDAGHGRGIGLIIVIDELHRPAEQAALGVDFLLPNLVAEQGLLAGARERAGLRHAEADLDRRGATLREGSRRAQGMGKGWGNHSSANASIEAAPGDAVGHGFLQKNAVLYRLCLTGCLNRHDPPVSPGSMPCFAKREKSAASDVAICPRRLSGLQWGIDDLY